MELALRCWDEEGRDLGVRRVADGRVGEAVDAPEEGHLVPGFVDLHIHGAYGSDFMTASTGDILAMCDSLADDGYDAWLPTTVTASLDDVRAALSRLPAHPMIEGFHLEGPFISPAFPGAQPAQFIRTPQEGLEKWGEVWDDPRLRVVTFAPEEPGGPDLARLLSSKGVRPSMGHTNASYVQAKEGIAAGVCHATHTFNAMKGLHHREPGALGAVLGDRRVLAELIYDRIHVHPGAAQILLAAKGLDGVTAISDGTMASGMPEGTEFEVWGHKVVAAGGEVRLRSNGALAGSAITLRMAFENLAQDFGVEAAVRLCCVNPRKALGLTRPPRTFAQFDAGLRFTASRKC